MAGPLETQLIISADDRTAAAFASVQGKLAGLESTMAALGRISGPMDRISGAGGAFALNTAPLDEALARHASIVDTAGAAMKAASGSLVFQMGEAMIAYEGMKVAAEGVGQAMDQAHERMRMDAAGMSPAEIEDADKLSSDLVQQYPSITQSDAMALARNARASFGSYATAKELLPEIAQSYVVAQAAKPNADPEQIREDYELLIKGLEIKGVTQNPAEFKRMMEGINKGINAFGDTLKTSDYYEMIKYARQAGITLSTDFMVGVAPAIAQRMRGSSAGRAFADFDAAIVGGKMEHSGYRELLSLGLLSEADVDRTKTGEIKGLKPGHQIAGADLAATNQYEWEQKFLMPALTAHNILTPEQISEHLSKFLSNKYAAQLGLIYATQQPSIEKDLVMEREAKGGASAQDFLARDPLLASKALSNTLTNLIAANTPSGNSIAGLENVATQGLQQLGEAARFSKEHDFFSDLKTDFAGWRRVWDSIHVGGPESTEQWKVDQRVARSLWDAGYGQADLAAELDREARRGEALSHGAPSPIALSPLPAQPAAPASVSVNGSAQVEQTLRLDVHVDLDPTLRARIDHLVGGDTNFTVPLAAPTGRMDTDAAPNRTGGM